ncbi:helix-turn-helix domain-containing protein [Saccharopolyspora sp. NPDC002376]
MSDFGRTLRQLRQEMGLTQPQLARRVHVDQSTLSRWENGRAKPDSAVAERLDETLNASGRLAQLVAPPTSFAIPPAREPTQPVTSGHVDELRQSISQLVGLDGQHGGVELAPIAARLFRTASTQLAAGRYEQSIERDFAAITAELGEVAGWLAFDSMHFDAARSLNLAALHLARSAGDRDMELFLLGNTAMQAQEVKQPREALRTVQLMETFKLSPRLRVMTNLRRARAAADLGDERAFTMMRRAQSDLSNGVHRTDPEWAWWVTDLELTVHEGGMWHAFGQPARAVECYATVVESTAEWYRWARFLGGANLLNALAEVSDWREAENAAIQLHDLAAQVSSARAAQRIRAAAETARRNKVPSSVDDVFTSLVHHTA